MPTRHFFNALAGIGFWSRTCTPFGQSHVLRSLATFDPVPFFPVDPGHIEESRCSTGRHAEWKASSRLRRGGGRYAPEVSSAADPHPHNTRAEMGLCQKFHPFKESGAVI